MLYLKRRALTRRTALAGILGLTLAPFLRLKAAAPSEADPRKLVEEAKSVPLPPDIVWETNNDDPLIGSEKALRGGTFNVAIGAYPLTFRLFGPNSNDFFASWNRQFAMSSLVGQHPITDKFIPNLATHWSVQKDNQTIYYKLDRDAKWSDGKPITADDYVFYWRVMQSKFIVDPFQNFYTEEFLTSVDKVDDYTIRVVGTRPSWRPLYVYGIGPLPMHSMVVDKDWVERTNNEPQVVAGPYVVSDTQRGESITFSRVPNWWGDKKRYFIGQFNFEKIHLRVIQPDRELDYVRAGELDITQVSSRIWNETLNTIPDVQNGWLRRSRVFTDWPQGLFGLQMNTEAPIFQNREFRTAMHYLVDFDRINRNLMFDEYYRQNSFFEGTIFANPGAHARSFDPAKAKEYLAKAGYHPARNQSHGVWPNIRNAFRGLVFTRSAEDEIWVNDKGEKASFTLNYAAKSYEPHLTVIQQDFRNAGVDIRLQLLEPGTSFQRGLERKFEMWLVRMTAGFYPDPRQYLHSQFKDQKNNNDFWGFGTPEVDEQIEIYEKNMDAAARMDAIHRIDQIVHDEAFYLPFWQAPFLRLVYWDYLQFPETYLPRRTEQFTDWLVYWIDPAKKAALEEARRDNKPYPNDPIPDKDFYGVKQKFENSQTQIEA